MRSINRSIKHIAGTIATRMIIGSNSHYDRNLTDFRFWGAEGSAFLAYKTNLPA